MIPDECPPPRPEIEASSLPLRPANDNGVKAAAPIDPRILIIARALGRLIAREQLGRLRATNDNRSEDER